MDAAAFHDYKRRPVWIAPMLAALSCVLVVGGAIAFLDRPISTFSHDVLHRPAWGVDLTYIARVPGPLAAVALVYIGIRFLQARRIMPPGSRLSRAERITLAMSLATLLATLACILLKEAFGRLWPETWVHPPNPSWIGTHSFGFMPFHGGKGYESFPSGHTTRVTAPFSVLWRYVPRWRALWVVPTIAVMAGLLASDFHFFGDCLAGIYLGATAGALVIAWLRPVA